MQLFVLFLAVFAPNIDNLGDDSYAVREWETVRCDNPVSATFLPFAHENPEIDSRLKYLKRRHPDMTPREVERIVFRRDGPRWVLLYVVTDRTALSDYECFLTLHSDGDLADALFALWPSRYPYRYTGWLRGGLVDGEYDRWLDHRDYHLCRAPMPRDK